MSTPNRLEPILSDIEVQAILDGSNVKRHKGLRSDAESIDLLASDRVIEQMIPALSPGYVRLSNDLKRIFTSVLRRKVEVREQDPEILSGRGLSKVIEQMPCLLALKTLVFGEDLGYSILAFDSTISYAVIERLFGSSAPSPSPPGDREPTNLERRMLVRSLDPIIRSLNENHEPQGAFDFQPDRIESSLDLISGITADITILHIPFVMELGDTLCCISLALPTPVLQPIKSVLCAPLSESKEVFTNMAGLIHSTPVSLAVELGSSLMKLRDVLALKPGDVVSLDTHPNDELPVQIEGVGKFRGLPVHQDGAIAIEISRKTI